MPLQATSGAASYDAFGGGVAAVPNYIEDVFSTYLYTGNAGTQTVTNGIDLSTKGGMVWIKSRSNAYAHSILDTVRGFNYSGTQTKRLDPSTTGSQADEAGNATQASPLSDGFSVTTSGGGAINFYNASGATYASWTFRKQPKFFDVVTYTGDGTNNRTVAHNLTSTPGCIIVKRTDSTGTWYVYHRSTGLANFLVLNTTAAVAGAPAVWDGAPTSTTFTIQDATTNINGATYVAYLFAHDAGGFGLTGTDNVISCGSFTTDASGRTTIDLGYEPQWVLIKRTTGGTGNWEIADNMRRWTVSGNAALYPNLSNAENNPDNYKLNATGFSTDNGVGSSDFIYIAIRRGPMKVPTSGTSVFAPVTYTGNGSTQNITTSINADWILNKSRNNAEATIATTRLAGYSRILQTDRTDSEIYIDPTYFVTAMSNTGFSLGFGDGNSNTYTYSSWNFRRAPSFFDEVCYTGTGSATTFSHNLGVAPEMMIVKGRTNTFSWFVYQKDLTSANESFLTLNTDSSATSGSAVWNSTSPTSSVFSVGSANAINQSGNTYVAYLFATCAGVSKVFSYTGNGSSQTINCGFTGGARFVLIKRTDSTGDWYVWDSARGIVSGNDPHLSLNTTAAEVTTDDTIDTDSTGFVVNQVSATNVNVSSATYIGIAIA